MSTLVFRNAKARIPEWYCRAGERWLLRAPTGWGKTVWLRQLALLRDADDSEICWRGTVVQPANVAQYRSQWMYLPQAGFRSTETIAEHLRVVLAIQTHRQLEYADFLNRFRQTLEAFGLTNLDCRRRFLHDLSGGELQAISLARAVLLAPEALLLDEPTSAMDGDLAQRVEQWIFKNFTGAWVWVTHDPRQADRLLAVGARTIDRA